VRGPGGTCAALRPRTGRNQSTPGC
jgi:hypothetical protein